MGGRVAAFVKGNMAVQTAFKPVVPVFPVVWVAVCCGDIVYIRVHNTVKGIMTQKSKAVILLGIGLCKAEQVLQKQPCFFGVHTVGKVLQGEFAPRIVHLIKIQRVGTVAAKNKGAVVARLVLCNIHCTNSIVFVGKPVRHNRTPF